MIWKHLRGNWKYDEVVREEQLQYKAKYTVGEPYLPSEYTIVLSRMTIPYPVV